MIVGDERVLAIAPRGGVLLAAAALLCATSAAASGASSDASATLGKVCFSPLWPLPYDPEVVIEDCAAATRDRDAVRAGTAALHVGAALARLGRNGEAVVVLTDAITYLRGRDGRLAGRAYLARGRVYAADHATDEAIVDLAASVERLSGAERVDAELALADACWARNVGTDADRAGELFAGVLAAQAEAEAWGRADRIHAYLGLGAIAVAREEWGAAVEHYRRAAAEDPDRYDAQLGLGQTALRIPDRAAALVAFERAYQVARAAEPRPGAASAAATGAAEALRQLGRRDGERLQFLERAAVEAPAADPSYLVAYADELAWGPVPDLAGAERWYAEANARAREADAAIWLKLARVQFRTGAAEASTASVQRARALAPDAPDVVLFDGQLAFALGRWQEAVDAFWKAKNLPDPEVRSEARYSLSRLFTEAELDAATFDRLGVDLQRYPRSALAVGFADEAVKQSRDAPRFRAQACLARVKYLPEIGADEAIAACDQVGATAEGQLLRGLAHLRAAPLRGAWRVAELDAAYRAFDRGLHSEGAGPIEARLQYGRGMALLCDGFDAAASAHFADLPSEWEWFQSYGATCAPGEARR